MESWILAIISFIMVTIVCGIVINEIKRSWLLMLALVFWSVLLGGAIRDCTKYRKSPKPKATEVYKDAVTLRTDSIIVFLK